MKQFFWKKYCFATVFIGLMIVFSVLNFVYNFGKWEKMVYKEEHQTVDEWIDCAEDVAEEEVLGRMCFIEAYGEIQKLLGKQEFNRFSFIKDTDGMMYYGSVYNSLGTDLEGYAENVRRMQDVVEAKGAKLIVVIPPAKVLYGVSEVNRAWPINDPNGRMDKFLNLLMEKEVFAVDMRPAMQKSGEPLKNLFFKTDHHWTPLAAFYAARELVKQVNVQYGDNWDPQGYYTDLSNYNTKLYEQCMLGSTGRNTGMRYSGLDDYLLLYPECDMEFTWINYEDDEEKSGSFTEAFLDMSKLHTTDLYHESANMVYLQEVVTHDKIENHSNENGPKLTVLRDSYFSPMACFLAPMCSEMDMIWEKRTQNDMDFEQFVRESDADYVILEIYPYDLTAESFDFFHEEEKQEEAIE